VLFVLIVVLVGYVSRRARSDELGADSPELEAAAELI
jgi:hypothetical protein